MITPILIHPDDVVAIACRSPLILNQCVDGSTISAIAACIASLPAQSWQNGDESPHRWAEHHISSDALTAAYHVHPLLEELAHRAKRVVGWINRFGRGAWIESHRDVAGDLHCIIPIQVPPCGGGGQLWIGTCGREMPAAPGDLLLFNATALPHGTTEIVAFDTQRVTLNLRFWLAAA